MSQSGVYFILHHYFGPKQVIQMFRTRWSTVRIFSGLLLTVDNHWLKYSMAENSNFCFVFFKCPVAFELLVDILTAVFLLYKEISSKETIIIVNINIIKKRMKYLVNVTSNCQTPLHAWICHFEKPPQTATTFIFMPMPYKFGYTYIHFIYILLKCLNTI